MDWKLILCMGLAAAGLLFGLSQWLRARRQLERMDRMLDRAIDGSFLESSFDESVPSALESKMSRFLNGSASSARNLAEEKSKIAALIADVSHQTKTPIANLLLYASLQSVSENQYEAARIDGAGFFQQFWYITLPNIKGSLALCALLRTIDSFRLFDKVNLLTGELKVHLDRAEEGAVTSFHKSQVKTLRDGRITVEKAEADELKDLEE